MNDQDCFVRLVTALAPWGHQLVFVGGWAHRLYRLHLNASVPIYQPVATLDADVAFADRARLDGNMKKQLQDAGFEEQLMGDHRPPVSKYTVGDNDGAGFYAEFLTPLIGRPSASDGTPLVTLERAGVTAQRLRYLELLLVSPWNVRLPEDWGEPIELRIPNPVSYIVQKLLIHDDRTANKKAQDILYIHDTIELFGSVIDELRLLWREQVQQALHERWQKAMRNAIADIFGTPSDTIRSAALIPQDRNLDPERMRQMCLAFLEELLD